MPFYWLLPGSQIPFPPRGLEIEHTLWASVSPALCFLWLHSSWFPCLQWDCETCIQPDKQFDLHVCLIKAVVQLVQSQAPLKRPGAQFFTLQGSWGWLILQVYRGISELNLFLESQQLLCVLYHHVFWEFILCYIQVVNADTVWYWLQHQPLWWCLPSASRMFWFQYFKNKLISSNAFGHLLKWAKSWTNTYFGILEADWWKICPRTEKY